MSAANGNSNGHAGSAVGELRTPVSTPLSFDSSNANQGTVSPLPDVIDEGSPRRTILEMKTGLYAHGRNRALLSGASKPVVEDQKALEEHARAMARETYRDRFDPAQHPHDKARHDEYQHKLAQRSDVQQGLAHAIARLRDADVDLAKAPKAEEKPTANPWLLAASVIAITLSVAPTLHDRFFFTLGDDLLAWMVSAVGGGFVAALLTLAIITGRRSVTRWVGLAAGVGVGIALGVIRLSTAESSAEWLFAFGLTIFEVAAVLLLEWTATGLRETEDKWTQAKKVQDESMQLHDAAQINVSRWTSRLEDINQAVREHIAYVENRSAHNLQVSELEDVAVKAVLDGYNAGISENIGRILGVWRAQ